MTITIHDVAREAGVSISTVSKVIHGSTRISQPTKDRVRAVMERLDFQPNNIARSFVMQSSGTIGVLTDMRRDSVSMTPHVYEVLAGVENALMDAGYILSLFHITSPEEIRERMDTMTRGKRIDAFILHTSWLTDQIVKWILERGIPFVEIGTDRRLNPEHMVDVDNALAGEIAASHLLDIGCRRPVFFAGGSDDGISARRLAGIAACYDKRGFKAPDEPVIYGTQDPDRAFEIMSLLLSAPKGQRPDGIICANNFSAQGAIKAARKLGIPIPSEIAFVGFDDFPLAPYLEPPLSVVKLDMFSLGIEAARSVIRGLGKKGARPDAVPIPVDSALLPPELIIRASSVVP